MDYQVLSNIILLFAGMGIFNTYDKREHGKDFELKTQTYVE